MKFEVGKRYKLRDDSQYAWALITNVDLVLDGTLYLPDGTPGQKCNWTDDGKWTSGTTSDLDLIDEYPEPIHIVDGKKYIMRKPDKAFVCVEILCESSVYPGRIIGQIHQSDGTMVAMDSWRRDGSFTGGPDGDLIAEYQPNKFGLEVNKKYALRKPHKGWKCVLIETRASHGKYQGRVVLADRSLSTIQGTWYQNGKLATGMRLSGDDDLDLIAEYPPSHYNFRTAFPTFADKSVGEFASMEDANECQRTGISGNCGPNCPVFQGKRCPEQGGVGVDDKLEAAPVTDPEPECTCTDKWLASYGCNCEYAAWKRRRGS